MKKIININFHSRVIPIEETAYEILQQYVESLRRYFANEEGRDEIISDIENRFAELFSESLKKGATCITDADVNVIITSMGRPEDFGDEDLGATAAAGNSGTAGAASAGYVGPDGGTSAGTGSTSSGYTGAQQSGSYSGSGYQDAGDYARRLYRADNDKILGGVCAGLANYLKLDPAIVRILFVLITFGWGAGVLLYLILWVVLPTKSLPANARKRLYRNSDDRVIAGIAGGLAAYFHIEVWIPRLIFALPLILSILTSIVHTAWFDWEGPVFFTGGFGGTLFITYIVLWIVLPEAVTASEKLEMRGEKVDLESIKNTIKNDLENFSKKAKDAGSEIRDTVQKAGDQVRRGSQNFAAEAGPIVRKSGTGFGHAIGVMFKAFFLFIAGIIAFALITVLASLFFRGEVVLTFKNYILQGVTQNFLAWAAFLLFLVIPVVALLTWLIRRITGVRSRNNYLGYTFSTLWVIGLICFISLVAMVMRNFNSRQHVEDTVNLATPASGALLIKVAEGKANFYDNDYWFDFNWGNDAPFHILNDDSVMLNTVRVNLLKSTDSFYHAQVLRFSHGNNSTVARQLASQIEFTVHQTDSTLYLPHGFAITEKQKFRNQQVLVNVYIPVGKKVIVNGSVDDYAWFDVSTRNRHIKWNRHNDDDFGSDWDFNDWEIEGRHWASNIEYVMTPNGLVSTTLNQYRDKDNSRHSRKDRKNDSDRKATDDNDDDENPGYRYKGPAPKKTDNVDSTGVKRTASTQTAGKETQTYLLSALFTM